METDEVVADLRQALQEHERTAENHWENEDYVAWLGLKKKICTRRRFLNVMEGREE